MAKPLDAKTLGRILDEHSRPLRLYASQWSRTPEDCVQEAFVALASQIPPPENEVAWLYRVVRNRAINELRANQRRAEREKIAARHFMTESQNQIELEESQAQLMKTLDGLKPEDRELIVLRIWSGLTWAEIGELTGASSSSAQRNYVSALKLLKKRLEQNV